MTALRRRRPLEIWPAFVDATSSLLLVVVFALLLAVLGQLVLGTALAGRDEALASLGMRISKLAEILSLEQDETARLEQLLAVRTASLTESQARIGEQQETIRGQTAVLAERELKLGALRDRLSDQIRLSETLQRDIEALTALRDQIRAELEQQIAAREDIRQQLQTESALNLDNLAQIALLNKQLGEFRQQLAALADALEIAEQEIADRQIVIEDLGQRLNTALASKARQLQRYRSEFFGRLRETLGQYPDIRIEGDRFILPSELLFESGSDQLGAEGLQQVARLARTLNEIAAIIPADIDWILRVDGHTDRRPINSERFQSNWELSAARAISLVRQMAENGVPLARMAAAGFAEYHPVDPAETAAAYGRNRRIELKLTSR